MVVGGAELLFVFAVGEIGETTRANVFAIAVDGSVATSFACGLLLGVIRVWVIVQVGVVE